MTKLAPTRSLGESEVFRFESGMFGDSGKHFGADFYGIVKRPGVFAHSGVEELGVGAA